MPVATPTSFPVWLQAADGSTILCQDPLSYNLLLPKGYVFNTSNPPINHPGSLSNAQPTTPPKIETSINRSQPDHPNPTAVR